MCTKILFAAAFIFSIISTASHHVNECFDPMKPVGLYFGLEYQIAFAKPKDSIELKCGYWYRLIFPTKNLSQFNFLSDDILEANFTTSWSVIKFKRKYRNLRMKTLNLKSKKFGKRFHVSKSKSLQIRKITLEDFRIYLCSLTTQEDEPVHKNVSYLLHVQTKSMNYQEGSSNKWRLYQNSTILPAQVALYKKYQDNTPIALDMMSTEWGKCLCGVTKFDTKRYRLLCPIVQIRKDEENVILLPTNCEKLKEFDQQLFDLTQNITAFHEYEICVDDCVPDVLENEDPYRYNEQLYLQEGINYKLTCPDTKEESDILWIREEETIIDIIHSKLETNEINNSIFMDNFHNLYLNKVGNELEGMYSCIVDNFAMKEFHVIVLSKHVLLTKECQDAMINLSYIMIVTFVLCAIFLIQKLLHEIKST